MWRFQGLSSVKQVELLAIRAGLQLAKTLRCNQVAVETDSLEALAACNGSSVDLSNFGFIANNMQV